MFIWFFFIIVYSHLFLNLYPYFINDVKVANSIRIIQFISLKDKGVSFKEIKDNFKDDSDIVIQNAYKIMKMLKGKQFIAQKSWAMTFNY